MVERQFFGREFVPAILAHISVTREDISSVEFYFGSRQPVVEKQANDSGYCDMEVNCGNPVVSVGIVVAFEFADFAPAFEVIVEVRALFQ